MRLVLNLSCVLAAISLLACSPPGPWKNCSEGPWSATQNVGESPLGPPGTTRPSAKDGCDRPINFVGDAGAQPDLCSQSCEALCLPAPEALDVGEPASTVTSCKFVILQGDGPFAITGIMGEPNVVVISQPVIQCDYVGIVSCDVASPGYPVGT